MSAIAESRSGDKIKIIQDFHASPKDQSFTWDTSREFKVGNTVLFNSFFHDRQFQDQPGLGWMIVFKANDGKSYSADQTFFVTVECWDNLRKHFTKGKQPRRRKAAHS